MLAIECQSDRIDKRIETRYLDCRAETLDVQRIVILVIGPRGPVAQRIGRLREAPEAVTITLLHVGDSPIAMTDLENGTNWSWRLVHRQGDVVEQVCEVADEIAADLLVMTTSGYDGVRDVTRGTTTEQSLRRSRCPVLAVPAKYTNIKY